jgi:CheY-like chemotaxis protein
MKRLRDGKKKIIRICIMDVMMPENGMEACENIRKILNYNVDHFSHR